MSYSLLTCFLFSALLFNLGFACSWIQPDLMEGSCPDDTGDILVDCNNYGPVCAFFEGENCKGGLCQRYVDADACTACNDPSIQSYRQQPCTGEKVFCDAENRPQYCFDVHFQPVCAHIANCRGGNCIKNIRNPCNACQDPTVDYYIRGRCLKRSEKRTYCDSKSQPAACDKKFEPVCAYQRDCSAQYNNPACAKTISNGCTACGISSIEFYVPGECPNEKNYCDPNNRPIREETPIDSCQPTVCVHLSDCTGDNCTTYEYLPVACAESNAEYYTLGAC